MSGCESVAYPRDDSQWSSTGVDDSATQIKEFEEHFEKLAFGDANKNSIDDGRPTGFETSPPAPEINITGPNFEAVPSGQVERSPDIFADFCASIGIVGGSRSAPPCLDVDKCVPNSSDPATVELQRVIRRQQDRFFRVAGVEVNPNFLYVQPTGAAASSKSESSILDVCSSNDGPLLAKAPKLSSRIGRLETRAASAAVANRKTSIPSSSFSTSTCATSDAVTAKQLVSLSCYLVFQEKPYTFRPIPCSRSFFSA